MRQEGWYRSTLKPKVTRIADNVTYEFFAWLIHVAQYCKKPKYWRVISKDEIGENAS
jgi:hypothetical protein